MAHRVVKTSGSAAPHSPCERGVDFLGLFPHLQNEEAKPDVLQGLFPLHPVDLHFLLFCFLGIFSI